MKTAILFTLAFCAAFAVTVRPASAGTCEQQCYAAYQACLADGHTPKLLCNAEKSECLADCP